MLDFGHGINGKCTETHAIVQEHHFLQILEWKIYCPSDPVLGDDDGFFFVVAFYTHFNHETMK